MNIHRIRTKTEKIDSFRLRSEQIARGETSHSPTDSSHEHLFYLNPLFARNIYKYKDSIYNLGGLIWKSMQIAISYRSLDFQFNQIIPLVFIRLINQSTLLTQSTSSVE
jgi:hypothetical protein